MRNHRLKAACCSAFVALLGCAAIAVSGSEARAGPSFPVIEYSLELALPGADGGGYVDIHLYALDDGGDMAARQAEGRAAMLARFPGATLVEPTGVSAAFKLFPSPVRWPQPSASWLYNSAGSTNAMPASAAFKAIATGAEGWDDAGGSGFHFDYLGETTTPTGCDGNPAQFVKDGKNIVGWGHIIGGHLGYSCHWRSAAFVDGTPFFAIQEFDIVLEPLASYSEESLRALVLHEFGHGLGLDHTETQACPGKVMCPGAAADDFTTPQPDDIAGVVWLYGVAPSPTPAPTPAGQRPFRAFGPGVARD